MNDARLTDCWLSERLDQLSKFIDYRGKTPKKKPEGLPLITAKNIRDGYIKREPREYIAIEDYDEWMTRGIPREGDVVITTEAPMGNAALLNITEKFAIAQRIICMQFYISAMGRFAHYALRSPEFQKTLTLNSTGTTVSGIKAATLKGLLIPVPPLAEQKVIADKLDTLLAQVENTKNPPRTHPENPQTLPPVRTVCGGEWAVDGRQAGNSCGLLPTATTYDRSRERRNSIRLGMA